MDTTQRDKWRVRAAALVIFLLGAAAGTLAPRVYNGWLRQRPAQQRVDRFAEMSERLQLSDEQKTQVQQIFGDTREQLRALRQDSDARVAEIRRQADERLQKVLTPEQWQRFQQARDEMRERHGHGGGRGGRSTSN
jgi:Spy/CpxP family protein refolding chaperone